MTRHSYWQERFFGTSSKGFEYLWTRRGRSVHFLEALEAWGGGDQVMADLNIVVLVNGPRSRGFCAPQTFFWSEQKFLGSWIAERKKKRPMLEDKYSKQARAGMWCMRNDNPSGYASKCHKQSCGQGQRKCWGERIAIVKLRGANSETENLVLETKKGGFFWNNTRQNCKHNISKRKAVPLADGRNPTAMMRNC